ncbi:MAG: hypothetical protein DHS20C18_20880 [Saprospiraceae bacterium]|nr:MAG: hypothetical protein DHS20C18_20880 [Saprospiraceae bacterium]
MIKTIAENNFYLLDGDQKVGDARNLVAAATYPYILIERKDAGERFFYLYIKDDLLDELSRLPKPIPVKLALRLHEQTPLPTLAANAPLTAKAEDCYVILENDQVVGFIYEEKAEAISPPAPSVPESSKGSTRGGSTVEEPDTFEAYPSISDPGVVKPGATFKVFVGFSPEQDESLEEGELIVIDRPDEDVPVKISLMVTGGKVADKDNRAKPVALDADAQTSFTIQVNDQATEVNIIAIYRYNKRVVGNAMRIVPVEQGVAAPAPTPVVEAGKKCSLSIASVSFDKPDVDLTVLIRQDRSSGELIWQLDAPNPEIAAQAATPIADAREFAKKIGSELKAEDFKDDLAHNILITLGESIADLLPDAFFEALKKVHDAIDRTPRLMIWTDEAYIPWELAYGKRLTLDDTHPRFLGAQTILGRWWLHDRVVTPPPSGLKVQQLSAIAANYDPFEQAALPEALVEKTFLEEKFKAIGVPATSEGVLGMTLAKPVIEGNLVHMALHGHSDSVFNEQKLILEDGKGLSPNAMFGSYDCGDSPAIAFMFLNACQVGTAGETLGQASGFPGTLLKKGMLGFIAPLWEVHDVAARNFAETFYEETLNKKRPVAEVLLDLRRGYDYKESLTPLAYLFYGHPGLTLDYKHL